MREAACRTCCPTTMHCVASSLSGCSTPCKHRYRCSSPALLAFDGSAIWWHVTLSHRGRGQKGLAEDSLHSHDSTRMNCSSGAKVEAEFQSIRTGSFRGVGDDETVLQTELLRHLEFCALKLHTATTCHEIDNVANITVAIHDAWTLKIFMRHWHAGAKPANNLKDLEAIFQQEWQPVEEARRLLLLTARR